MKFSVIVRQGIVPKEAETTDSVRCLYQLPDIDPAYIKLFYRNVYLDPTKTISHYFMRDLTVKYIHAFTIETLEPPSHWPDTLRMIKKPIIFLCCYLIFLKLCTDILQELSKS